MRRLETLENFRQRESREIHKRLRKNENNLQLSGRDDIRDQCRTALFVNANPDSVRHPGQDPEPDVVIGIRVFRSWIPKTQDEPKRFVL